MTLPYTRTLKYTLPMMQGADVQALQQALVQQGILHRSGANGLFGPHTRRAVETFQRQNGLEADGLAGRQTFDALRARLNRVDVPVTPGPVAEGTARKLQPSWMPSSTKMTRVILHWTGGGYTPTESEKGKYHILIDGDGAPHRGKHPITANEKPITGSAYAAHTLNANSGAIGVSLCAMGGDAAERPFKPGPTPITRAQWEAMAQIAAELCLRYRIPVTRKTVLGHGEVQANLGIAQTGKWDPMVVPWDVGRPYLEVGDEIRARVADILEQLSNPGATPNPVAHEIHAPPSTTVMLRGAAMTGAEFDGRDWVDLRDLAQTLGLPAALIDPVRESATFTDQVKDDLRLAIAQIPDTTGLLRTWVPVNEVSDKLGLALRFDDKGKAHLENMPGDTTTHVKVRSGQTLSKIARQYLGDSSRWHELRKEDGSAFDEQSALNLQVGQIVLLPAAAAGTPPPSPSPGVALTKAQITTIADRIARFEAGSSSMQDTRRAAVAAILTECQARSVLDLSHQAYILATAYHETNLGQWMTELWGPTKTQKTYGSRLGNRNKEEGFKYRGRGFVQITGRNNYIKYGKIFKKDFVGDPDQVAKPDIAAKILVRGMAVHGFTGKGLLADMGHDGDFDWFRARSLINGDKNKKGDSRYPGLSNGEGIARKARKYRDMLATM